jgi:peptide/nickel transport system substrate-binding protein
LVNSLAVRQAFQYGIDQLSIIKALYNGYGVPGYGPIPTLPTNAFSGGLVNHYAFSISKGIAALKKAGFTWDNNTSDAAVCTAKAGCGSGIATGTKLALTYKYATGSPTQDAQMQAEVASWAKEGIQVTLSTDTPDNIASLCTSGAGSAPTTNNPNGNGDWQICQYGGWLYAPDYYPSGELLFYTGAISNPGEYSDTTMDSLIDATTKGNAALNAGSPSYAQYAMDQLPYMYQPTGTGTGEISKTLKGVLPPNPTGASLPEYLSK